MTVHKRWIDLKAIGHIETIRTLPTDIVRIALRTTGKLILIDFNKAISIHSEALLWIEQLSALAESRDIKVRIIARKGTSANKLLKLMRYHKFVTIVDDVVEALQENTLKNFSSETK